jgi:UDP:flavonoid glycosyltransferase YjiC (YdhE family)
LTRKAVLATIGTLGDLHPFIALALAMQKSGFEPVIATAAEYREKVEAAGVAFFPARPSFAQIERDLGMDRPALTRRAIVSTHFLFRKLVLPYARENYDDIMVASDGAEVMLISSLGFGARLAAEKRGLAWIAVVLQPMMFFSAYDPPVIRKAEWITRLLRRLGPRGTAQVFRVAKRLFAGPFAPLHSLRREIGLPPTPKHPLFEGQFSRAGAIGLYSQALGPVQPDYPAPASIVGFATLDGEDGGPGSLDAGLSAWLAAGEAPLVFTLGSMIVNSPGGFYQQSLAAARRLQRRALLLVGEGYTAQFERERAEGVFVCGYAPHALLFHRAAAVIHHGGIGTLAQALRSGRPQLIVPFYADQIDNAARASRLGLAQVLPPARYRAARAAKALAALLSNADVLEQAAKISESLLQEDGAIRASQLIP